MARRVRGQRKHLRHSQGLHSLVLGLQLGRKAGCWLAPPIVHHTDPCRIGKQLESGRRKRTNYPRPPAALALSASRRRSSRAERKSHHEFRGGSKLVIEQLNGGPPVAANTIRSVPLGKLLERAIDQAATPVVRVGGRVVVTGLFATGGVGKVAIKRAHRRGRPTKT